MESQTAERPTEEDVGEIGVGRIVHLVIERSYERNPDIFEAPDAFCRPAIVVRSWAMQHGTDGAVNMVAFLDGSNDGINSNDSHWLHSRWFTSIPPNHAVKIPSQWHWPRECGRMAWAESVMVQYPGHEKATKVYHNHVMALVDPDHCQACKAAQPA